MPANASAPVPRPAPAPGSSARVATATPPAPAPRSRLGSIRRGQLARPLRYLFYSMEGVGKSTLAADAPAPIFLDVEGGADQLDIARYPYRDEDGGHIPRSYDEVLAAVDDLCAAQHEHRTVVIDTVDALEALLHRHVCEAASKGGEQITSIEGFGYGKGFTFALDEWRRFLHRLERLRERGISVVLLGHAVVRTFKNPTGEDFDRYQLRVQDKAAGLLKEWSDVVGFLRFDEGAGKLRGTTNPNDRRARGWSTGRRLISLAREAAWDAKTRVPLPAEIELPEASPWSPFEQAGAAREQGAAELRAEVDAELGRLGDSFRTSNGEGRSAEAVRAAADRADVPTLHRILAALRASEPSSGAA